MQLLLDFQVKYRKHKKNNKAAGGNGTVSATTAALGVKAAIQESSHGNNHHVKSTIGLINNHSTNGKVSLPHGMDQQQQLHQHHHHQQQIQHLQQQQQHAGGGGGGVVPRIANGNILKTALTNPSEVLHLRRRLESAVTSSRDTVNLSYESAMPTICTLIYCDEFEDIATLKVLHYYCNFLFKKLPIISICICLFFSWMICWIRKQNCQINSVKLAILSSISWCSGPNDCPSILNCLSK